MTVTHPWLPRASCGSACVRVDPDDGRARRTLRALRRAVLLLAVLPALPLLAVPMPGRTRLQRRYCRIVLRCLGVRIAVTGGPIRNLRGVLVVSGHVSWLDVFAVGAVLPGSFVAKAELAGWPALGVLARLLKVIPIDRGSLRRLPAVVDQVAARLRSGRTVIAFPEGTTWCGRGYGPFRPALFQSAVDAQRPVQPLRLSYRHPDGAVSTVPAYIGEDTLLTSIRRLLTTRKTIAAIGVESLQLPGDCRRDLAARCEAAVRATTAPDHVLAA